MSRRKKIKAGIGDSLDLRAKKPNGESVEAKVKTKHRYIGEEKHSIPIYPKLPFQYSVSYNGETLEDYNEQDYLFDIYAHPEKVFNYKVKETKVLPVDRLWETEAIFEATVKKNELEYAIEYDAKYPGMRQNTVRWKLQIKGRFFDDEPLDYYYAVKWKGLVEKMNHGDVKTLFKHGSSQSFLIGKVKADNWKWEKTKAGVNRIVDRTNTASVSAISTKKFIKTPYYDATFTFKPIGEVSPSTRYSTHKRTTGGHYKQVDGFDDDSIGIMFKVKDKNNFYLLLIEGDKRAYYANASRPPNNLEGYKVEKNTPYVRHGSNVFGDFTERSIIEDAEAYKWPWDKYEKKLGWGTFHRRLYRCKGGKLYRVDKTPGTKKNAGKFAKKGCWDKYKNGRGWEFEKNHKVKISSMGKRVVIEMQWEGGQMHKLYDFESDYTTGSVGVFNVSQAVAYSRIDIKEFYELEGRMPINTSSYAKNPGENGKSYTNLGKASKWLKDSFNHELDTNGFKSKSPSDIQVTKMWADIKSGYASKGKLTVPSSVNGEIKVRSYANTLNKAVMITLGANDKDDPWWSSDESQKDLGKISEYLEGLTEYRKWLKTWKYDPDLFVLDSVKPIVQNSKYGKVWLDKEDGHLYAYASKTKVWKKISGRIPNESDEWFSWNGSGDFTHALVAEDYIINDIKERLGMSEKEDGYEGENTVYDLDGTQFSELSGVVKNKLYGEVIINSPTAPIIARNYNALDAGEKLYARYLKCGVVHVTPDNNYDNCVVAFEDIRTLFDEEHTAFFGRKDLKNKKKTYNLILPIQQDKKVPPNGTTSTEGGCFIEPNVDEDEAVIQCYEDFFFDGTMLCMWSCEFPIVETEVEFHDKVHAYEGLMFYDPLSYFNPNDWTTYQLFLDKKGLNDELDEIYWVNGDPFTESKPGTKLALQTKEYYVATYLGETINKGIVTSDKPLYIKLPNYPESFISEDGETKMPSNYKNCDFLLDCFNNNPYVIVNWLSDYTATNTVFSVNENKPTLNGQIARSDTNENVPSTPYAKLGREGMPIIKLRIGDETFSVRHFIEVTCRTRPIATEWNSGKYVGEGILNGKKPYFNNLRGKNDIQGVSTDVITFPHNIIPETVKGPYIEVLDVEQPDNSRVKYVFDKDSGTLSFSSEYMDDFVWTTKWVSDWVEAANEYTVNNTEAIKIDTLTKHFLGSDFDFDEETKTITVNDIEIVSNHEFVQVWKNNLSTEQLEKINKNEDATVDIYAQMMNSMPLPWSPMIHNGYYYQEGIEHFLYAEKEQIERMVFDGQVSLVKRPEQGAPIIIKGEDGSNYRKTSFYDELWDLTHKVNDSFNGNGKSIYYLKYNRIDESTLVVKLNRNVISDDYYIFNENNSSIEFMMKIHSNDEIELYYELDKSFYIEMNNSVLDTTVTDDTSELFVRAADNEILTIEYEKAMDTPYYRAEELKLNPLLNNFHNGFIYIDNDEIKEPKFIEIQSSQVFVERLCKDEVLLTVKVTDELSNPLQNEIVAIYENEVLINSLATNEAGEAYMTIIPKDSSDLIAEYKAVCRNISNYTVVNLTRENEFGRYYIEIKPDTLLMKSNDANINVIKFRLMDENWNIMKNGYEIEVTVTDVIGLESTDYIIIGNDGYGYLELNTIGLDPGLLFIKAKYDMAFEQAVNTLYIRVIGE